MGADGNALLNSRSCELCEKLGFGNSLYTSKWQLFYTSFQILQMEQINQILRAEDNR